MNRSALKQFAVRAGNALLQAIRPLADSEQAAEHFAQLWFCRLTALRFMEVNECLPGGGCLFTDEDGMLLPSSEEKHLRRRILSLCRRLAAAPALTPLFGEDAAAFLPPMLLRPHGVLADMLDRLPPSEWMDFPEILGWLYQYRNTDAREQAFAQLRRGVKIAPDRIPAATQMFTPDWIVRYMTENALGTLCAGEIPQHWRYFLPPAVQPEEAALSLKRLHRKKAEALTVIDPCMGTGHILAYVFDALMDLYLGEGYPPKQAAARILEKNIFGLDIDETACALASFVLIMKARRYDADILRRKIRPKLYHFADLGAEGELFGSLLCPKPSESTPLCRVLNSRYDAVITNPPYMGSSSMTPKLSAFVRANYPEGKSDLFAAFMLRCAGLTAPHGAFAMITQHAWMFLSSYEALRRRMQAYTMQSMVHLGARAFSSVDVGTIVQTTAFVCMGSCIPDYRTTYLRLTEDEDKEAAFFRESRRYVCDTGRFSGISGAPVCYWVSEPMRAALNMPKLSGICRICQGMTTSDNKRFLRLWHETAPDSIAFGCADAQAAKASGKRWFPYNKGGKFRKWYGNNSYVVNYGNDGEEMRAFHAELNKTHSGGRIKNAQMYFRPAVTWPFITESTKFGVRFQPKGFLFDVSGSSLFPEKSDCFYLMGFLSSKVALEILKLYNPTMNFQVENIGSLPIIFDVSQKSAVDALVSENIAIARADWDSSETSWDFRSHPLVGEGMTRIADAFAIWEETCQKRLQTMQDNERRLNEIFIRIYGLEGELSPEVSESEITLRRADKRADACSLISFAVGCMFGRYHLKHSESSVLSENFLPLSEAVRHLEAFLTAAYGADTLEENLRFLADALCETGEPRAALQHYFETKFYADHCRVYRKRPIYWMVDSGRQHALRGLWYLHRMDGTDLEVLARHGQDTNAASEKAKAELADFLQSLEELRKSGAAVIPDDGVQRNYERFRKILSAIR